MRRAHAFPVLHSAELPTPIVNHQQIETQEKVLNLKCPLWILRVSNDSLNKANSATGLSITWSTSTGLMVLQMTLSRSLAASGRQSRSRSSQMWQPRASFAWSVRAEHSGKGGHLSIPILNSAARVRWRNIRGHKWSQRCHAVHTL